MRTTAVKSLENFGAVSQTFGTVLAVDDGLFHVRTDQGLAVQAARAVSCLVEPETHDRVLLAMDDKDVFVLAVLERNHAEHVTIACPGNVDVRLKNGSFRVQAQDEVDIVSGNRVSVGTKEFSLASNEATVAVKLLSIVGEKVIGTANQIKTVARSLDQTLERFTQRVKNSLRTVEQLDALRAQQIDHTAEETYHLRARQALVHSEKVVKMDAEQIQLG